MGNSFRVSRWVWWVAPLLAATLACSLPGQNSGAATQPSSESGAASPTATAVSTGTSGEGAPVDLCALPTPDEVKAVLGGPAKRAVWDPQGQDCDFFLDNSHLLIVQAGHEADGKALHLGGMEGVRNKIKDKAALQLLDQIKAQESKLTLLELVRMGLPVWRAAGYTAVEDPGVGDWSFWWYGQIVGFNMGELGTGRASGKWLGVYMTAKDQASAKALLRPLAAALLDRLPDNFTVTGKGY